MAGSAVPACAVASHAVLYRGSLLRCLSPAEWNASQARSAICAGPSATFGSAAGAGVCPVKSKLNSSPAGFSFFGLTLSATLAAWAGMVGAAPNNSP